MMSKKIRLKKGEVFKEIEGYKDRYYISNKGRLWSNVSGRFIGAKDKETGYIQTTLTNEEGERESTSIHREVGKAFVPNDDPENKIEINHKNYIRDDNRAENLEWVTRQENLDYSYERNSESCKKLWEDEDFRKKREEAIKKKWEDEDFRERKAEGIKKQWEDEDFRKRNIERVKKLWEDEDFREKMKEATKKKWEDEDFREMQVQKGKKLWEDEDFRKKIKETNSNLMKKRWEEDEDFRKKIKETSSNLMKKLNKDPNFREASRKARQKPLLQYTKEGELVSKFSSGREAVEKTGIRQSSISNALKGRLKTAGGFIWKYDQ